MNEANAEMIGDEELTAYLDGELDAAQHDRIEATLREDAELRARLARLEAGGRPFEASFVPLLGSAPTGRMEARLGEVLDAMPRAARPGPLRAHPAPAIAASLVLAFLAGIAADRGLRSLAPEEPQVAEARGWRDAVADYLALYTAQSLTVMPDDAQARAEELAGIAAALDIPLAPERVEIPGADFRRAQLLEYEGKPLAQIAYLDPQHGPLAFCVIRNGQPDAPPQTEERGGFNVVFWTEGGLGYMLIGRAPLEALTPRAETLSARL